jgi:protein-S-isoprenylcysteine O-methyltransferase Ste14
MLLVRLLIGCVAQLGLFAALLFIPAGTWHWARAWQLLGLWGAMSLVALAVMLPRHRGVLEERMRSPIRADQPAADLAVSLALVIAIVLAIVVIPVDLFHLHLLPEAGPFVRALGWVAFVVGFAVMCAAMMRNSFASTVVRHQRERGHVVVDTGLYGVVRHPMYAGAIAWLLGIALSLGSYVGALFDVLPVGVLVARIGIEERFLRRELDGYDAYTRRVPYRLVPFVW